MEVLVPQTSLHRALRLVGRVAPTRPALPILHHALLVAEPGRLLITAADHELAVVTSVAAEVRATGRATVRARLLDDYVAALPPEPVRLRLNGDGSRLEASCGRFTAGMPTADPDDFPATPDLYDEAVELDSKALREALARIAFAAAKDESRPVLRGLRCRFGDGGLSLAACDGFRVGRTSLLAPGGVEAEAILPARAAAEFGWLLAGAEACSLVVSPNGGLMALRAGGTTVFARLLEGPYPDIERAVPTGWRTRVRVETAALRRAVGVTGLFWTSFVGSPVVLEAGGETLRLRAEGAEVGTAEVELPARIEGDAQAICLATPYLADILAAVGTDHVELAWQEALRPAVVREVRESRHASTAPPSDDPSDDLWVLMPMHMPAASPASTGDVERPAAKAGRSSAIPSRRAA